MNSIEEVVSAIGGVALTALSTVYVGRAGNRASREGQRMQNDLDWRKQLQDEMKDLRESYEKKTAQLEARVEVLEATKVEMMRDLSGMGDFLDELSLFELYGRNEDAHPVPDENLGQYFDRARWLRLKDMHDARLEQQARDRFNGKDS